VKEGPRIGRLDERRRIERAVARRAEAVVGWHLLAGQILGLVYEILDARVEIRVAERGAAGQRRVRPRVAVADVALAEAVVEEDLLAALRDGSLERQRQRQLLAPAEGELERRKRIELLRRGQAEIDPRHPIERAREMLDHRAGGERAQRSVARCAVARPARARSLRRGHGRRQCERVRHPAQGEDVLEIGEPVEILDDQPELAHQPRILEILRQIRITLGDEQRIVVRQRGDECRIDGEVVLLAVTGTTGPAVTVESLVEEKLAAAIDELLLRIGRDLGSGLAGNERGERGKRHESQLPKVFDLRACGPLFVHELAPSSSEMLFTYGTPFVTRIRQA